MNANKYFALISKLNLFQFNFEALNFPGGQVGWFRNFKSQISFLPF